MAQKLIGRIGQALLGRPTPPSMAAPVQDELSLLTLFRARHHSDDPLLAWRRAEIASKPQRAFMAVVQDPTLLDTIDTLNAHAVARGARSYATGLLDGDTGADASSSSVAASFALAAVAAWLNKSKLFQPRTDLTIGSPGMLPGGILQTAWAAARRSFPQYDERTAAICLLAVLELGASGLDQLDMPELFTVGAARFAAWSMSGRLRVSEPTDVEDAAAALSEIQSRAAAHGKPVLHVSYDGRKATASAQALSLARDAMTCAGLVDQRPDLAAGAGAGLWKEAAARHAYAGVACQPSALMEQDLDTARDLVRHARAFATRLEEDEPIEMPLFPPDAVVATPRAVNASLQRF